MDSNSSGSRRKVTHLVAGDNKNFLMGSLKLILARDFLLLYSISSICRLISLEPTDGLSAHTMISLTQSAAKPTPWPPRRRSWRGMGIGGGLITYLYGEYLYFSMMCLDILTNG